MAEESWVVVGRLSGLFGVRGWFRVFSYTEPRDRILEYRPLYVQDAGVSHGWREFSLEQGHLHGRGIIAKFAGVDDRNEAMRHLNLEIAVRREQLPVLSDDEYYWSDLQGMNVVTVEGTRLGVVDYVFATGANDVLVVKGDRERLIPFLNGTVIKTVDLDGAVVEVDWDPEF